MKNFAILASATVVGFAAYSAQGAVISFNFDSDQAYGKTFLYNAPAVNMNPSGGTYSFDTRTEPSPGTYRTEGTASLRMQGQNASTFGRFVPRIDIGEVAADQVAKTQDLTGIGTQLSFDFRRDNTGLDLTTGQTYIRYNLWAGGTIGTPTDLIGHYSRSNTDGGAVGNFITITQPVTNATGTGFAPGWTVVDATKLDEVKFIDIYYLYSGGVTVANQVTFDAHMDNLHLSGPNVTVVPEPGALSAVGLVSVVAMARRRRSL